MIIEYFKYFLNKKGVILVETDEKGKWVIFGGTGVLYLYFNIVTTKLHGITPQITSCKFIHIKVLNTCMLSLFQAMLGFILMHIYTVFFGFSINFL